MGKTTRKKHSPEFKAKVAIEALKESSTLAELSKKYGVSQTQISRWKTEMISNASSAFGSQHDEDAHQKDIDRLHRKIGELEMEVDFLERASRKLGIPVPEKR